MLAPSVFLFFTPPFPLTSRPIVLQICPEFQIVRCQFLYIVMILTLQHASSPTFLSVIHWRLPWLLQDKSKFICMMTNYLLNFHCCQSCTCGYIKKSENVILKSASSPDPNRDFSSCTLFILIVQTPELILWCGIRSSKTYRRDKICCFIHCWLFLSDRTSKVAVLRH